MSQGPENLLESDRLDDLLEESAPPPVVVVQYGSRARSWLPIVAVTAALTLGGLLAYNWREARRLQVQALQARRALERVEEARVREIASQPPPDRPVVVAMDPPPASPTEERPAPAGTAPSAAKASGALPAE